MHRNDSELWAELSSSLRNTGNLDTATAEPLARRFVAEVRRSAGLTDTWAPGDRVPGWVRLAYDLDGGLWIRKADTGRWVFEDFDAEEHDPAAGKPHTTEQLLAEWGPITSIVSKAA